MTLDEAILHCQEVTASGCNDCCKEHEQLAAWLAELREFRQSRNGGKGKWFLGMNCGLMQYYCSECGHEAYWKDYGQELFEYCPYCGAEMEAKKRGDD